MNSPFIQSILHAANLIGNLSQTATNGNSVLGTLQAPTLPKHLPNGTNNLLANSPPWGLATVSNTNPYTSSPNTSVIRSYTFDIARGYLSPDGVNRSLLLINGQYPGPMIEANWGDKLVVTVNNQITGPAEGTSMHWHGILQKTSQWMDGVPAVQQCPIAPGKSFTYSFIADMYGTSWYHAHYSAQYTGGIIGPMIIHGPSSAPYDVDIGPVILGDWDHKDYYELVEATMGSPSQVLGSDNNLINGKGVFNCSLISGATGLPDESACTSFAGLAKFRFHTGKVHRLRLINAGSNGLQKFTLDGHTMTVIANDFVPVVPYTTNVVTLGVGQRTDILVNATGAANSSFWMRSEISSLCSQAVQPVALAAVYYPKANTSSTPPSNLTAYTETGCGNDPLDQTIPSRAIAAPAAPATTQTFYVSYTTNSTGHLLWQMSGRSFRGDYNSPVFLLASVGNTSYPDNPEWNVYNFGSNSSICIILENQSEFSHPFHLHGHHFMVVADAVGDTWDGGITRASNPQRRDTQMLQPHGYVVLEFVTDNPGVWPLHCHIAWHLSAGLYVNVMERPAAIKKLSVPSVMAQTCRDWWAFTNSTVVDQIDSGL